MADETPEPQSELTIEQQKMAQYLLRCYGSVGATEQQIVQFLRDNAGDLPERMDTGPRTNQVSNAFIAMLVQLEQLDQTE